MAFDLNGVGKYQLRVAYHAVYVSYVSYTEHFKKFLGTGFSFSHDGYNSENCLENSEFEFVSSSEINPSVSCRSCP